MKSLAAVHRPVLAAVIGLSAMAWGAREAQAAPAPPPVPMGDLARRDVLIPESAPNISGSWLAMGSNRSIVPMDGSPTPFMPWAKAYFDARAEAEAKGMPLFDPNASCLPSGVPRVISVPYPLDIVQTPERILIAIEVGHVFRVIHMDGAPKPADYQPSYLGWSVGHWEGDTLVVETTASRLHQVDEEGRPKSTQLRVVERYQKRAPDVLEITFLIDDPLTYTQPWTARAQFRWAPNTRLAEYICEENNRNKPDATGRLRRQ